LGAALHQLGHCLVGITGDPLDVEHDVSILDQAGLAQAILEGLDKRAIVALDGEPSGRKPIRTGLLACCARAASGHAAAPPTAKMNSRRLTWDIRIPPALGAAGQSTAR
jgi:hypothetical protein